MVVIFGGIAAFFLLMWFTGVVADAHYYWNRSGRNCRRTLKMMWNRDVGS